jgi:hypothetical protein
VAREVGWLVVPALCLTAVMVFLGYVVTDLLPSTAIGRWDADVPRRLLEYRQHDAVSESKIITTLSATPTIVVLTVLAAIVCRAMFGRWREALVVIYAAKPRSSWRPPCSSTARARMWCTSMSHRRRRHSRPVTPPQRCASTVRSPRS